MLELTQGVCEECLQDGAGVVLSKKDLRTTLDFEASTEAMLLLDVATRAFPADGPAAERASEMVTRVIDGAPPEHQRRLRAYYSAHSRRGTRQAQRDALRETEAIAQSASSSAAAADDKPITPATASTLERAPAGDESEEDAVDVDTDPGPPARPSSSKKKGSK